MKTKKESWKHLFGPVHSRRLGRSLGIDLIPHKTCTFNCAYCECGKTTVLTNERKEFFPLIDIQDELTEFFKSGGQADFVTFAGSGEPLLYSKFDELTNFIKDKFPDVKIALLTNSSLLQFYQRQLSHIDLLLPSLDAVSEKVFQKINRPHKSIHAKDVIENLIETRKNYSGQIWLEVFLAPGVNDHQEELELLRNAISKIRPDKLQLNSLDRPGIADWIKAMSLERMNDVKEFFSDFDVEIISFKKEQTPNAKIAPIDLSRQILDSVLRRPCTIDDLCIMTGADIDSISNCLSEMKSNSILGAKKEDRGVFYFSLPFKN